jgi:hypothetical protein
LLFDGVTLSVHRNVIPTANGFKLFQDLIALPTEVDVAIDPRVIGFLGDAGSPVHKSSSSADVVSKFYNLIQNNDDALHQAESAIVRMEYLQGKAHNHALDLIGQVAPPQVTEPEGTIHLYISPPSVAALDNHTEHHRHLRIAATGSQRMVRL